MDIVLASSNAGKLNEFRELFTTTSLVIHPQSEWHLVDAEETGSTFVENALIKARHAAAHTGLPAIADDSGLVIAALNGAPGVYSARYAGIHGNHDANIQKVLHEMATIPDEKREAYFHCCLVLVRNTYDPEPLICEAQWYGKIAHEKKGDYGFGYDPIFEVPEYECSAAELSRDIKNKISHRAQALQLLFEKFQNLK